MKRVTAPVLILSLLAGLAAYIVVKIILFGVGQVLIFGTAGSAWRYPLLISALLVAAFFAQRYLDRRRALLMPGVCGSCGYDRTGIPDGAPCPECGAPGRSP